MTNLRNPQLRVRDLRRLVTSKLHKITWDVGIEKSNEWVYVSLESDIYRKKLLNWLRSKGVEESAEVLCFDPSWSLPKKVMWIDILQNPESFFSGTPFQAVNMDLTWSLNYMKEGVARFGRWGEE